MGVSMPRFSYHFAARGNRRVLCIEEGGEIIHEIGDLKDFYQTFGYQPESLHADMLPDEFVWSEYINNASADFASCIQMHIIEYLRRHCEVFNEKYGAIYDQLVAAHEELKLKRGMACFACKAAGTSRK